MHDERLKVPVAVQQRQSVDDAAGGDDAVDGLADGDAFLAQCAEVPGRLHCHGLAAELHDVEAAEQAQDVAELLVSGGSLQHLGQDQVADGQGLGSQQGIQAIRLPGFGAAQVVDPYAGVDQDRASVLSLSRLPCH